MQYVFANGFEAHTISELWHLILFIRFHFSKAYKSQMSDRLKSHVISAHDIIFFVILSCFDISSNVQWCLWRVKGKQKCHPLCSESHTRIMTSVSHIKHDHYVTKLSLYRDTSSHTKDVWVDHGHKATIFPQPVSLSIFALPKISKSVRDDLYLTVVLWLMTGLASIQSQGFFHPLSLNIYRCPKKVLYFQYHCILHNTMYTVNLKLSSTEKREISTVQKRHKF